GDDGDDADRLAQDHAVDALAEDRGASVDGAGEAGVVLDHLRGAVELDPGLVDRLALLAREQLREALLLLAERLGEAVEHARAQPAVARPRRALERASCSLDGAVEVAGGGGGDDGDDLA